LNNLKIQNKSIETHLHTSKKYYLVDF